MNFGSEGEAAYGTKLTDRQKEWIRRADTFFIATSGPEHPTDLSHRGGSPRFVEVHSDQTLLFPDYFGNAMFNKLGNIHVNPRAGLLLISRTATDPV